MEKFSNAIVAMPSRPEYMRALAPTTGAFQGIAVPASGLERRLRPATSGTDLRPRTP